MTEADPFAPRRRRRWPWALALAVAVPVGLFAYVRWASERDLRLARAETTALDPGWRLPDLLAARDAAMLPPEQNAALVILAVENELPGQNWHPELFEAGWAKDGAPPNRLPTRAETDGLQVAVRELDKPLAAIHRAATLPGGYESVPVPDLKTFDVMKLSAPNWARKAAYAAQLDATAAAARNDPSAAVRGVRAGNGVARAVGDPPSNIAVLIRVAVAAVAARSCERGLAWCEPADGLAELQEEFRREAGVPLARAGLRGERAAYDVSMELIAAGGGSGPADQFGEHLGGRLGVFVSRPRWVREHAAGLRTLNRLLAAGRDGELRPVDARTTVAAVEAEFAQEPAGQNLLLKLLLPSLDKVLAACQRHEATQLTAQVGVACERFRRQHGRWPAALSDLTPGLMPAVPADPFDGRPLRLKRTDDGLIVYSVGENGTDDGGQPLGRNADRGVTGDVVFRLFDPDKRRLPAAEGG